MGPVIDISGVEFVLIPSGRFISVQREMQVEIIISKPFYLSKYPVTQRLWHEYMPFAPWCRASISPSALQKFAQSDNCPAVFVTLPEAMSFCEHFSKSTGFHCQLPSMAQWEHACRAGASTMYFWGDGKYDFESAVKYAWHEWPLRFGNVPIVLPEVGKRLPNPWGLHDMTGLVQEWVLDRHDLAPDCKIPKKAFVNAMVDPLAVGGSHGICMGGGFRNSLLSLACSSHVVHTVDVRQVDIGFRLAISPETGAGG